MALSGIRRALRVIVRRWPPVAHSCVLATILLLLPIAELRAEGIFDHEYAESHAMRRLELSAPVWRFEARTNYLMNPFDGEPSPAGEGFDARMSAWWSIFGFEADYLLLHNLKLDDTETENTHVLSFAVTTLMPVFPAIWLRPLLGASFLRNESDAGGDTGKDDGLLYGGAIDFEMIEAVSLSAGASRHAFGDRTGLTDVFAEVRLAPLPLLDMGQAWDVRLSFGVRGLRGNDERLSDGYLTFGFAVTF